MASSLSDLLLFEVNEKPGVPIDDVREVSQYVAAVQHGLDRWRGGFPLSLRLIREVHEVLLRDGRGAQKAPGEFRTSQVWIGGTRPGNALFVPPPAHEVPECLRHLERFLNGEPEPTPPLLKAALAHVQFETIHPFLDGSGRVGRLLITLQLIADGSLREPLLYPSLYFKEHRPTYYELLNSVRMSGDWETWIEFFFEAIESTATRGGDAARRLISLGNTDARRIESIGKAAPSAREVHGALQRQPIATARSLVAATGLTHATINKSLVHLERLGIVKEISGRRRDRVFA